MLANKFKMKMNGRVKLFTFISLTLIVGLIYLLYTNSSGSYLPAWFTTLIIAISALLALSIPRYIQITETSLEIHCLVELTVIPLNSILKVNPVSKRDMRWCLPVPALGVWGVFGYYGYYFDFKNLRLIKLYASHWGDFIMIENKQHKIVVISCKNHEEALQILTEKTSS